MISVIVPCYNSELYISDCVDSVRGQSNKDWELIIIDDSSSDNTWNVCKQISESDQRVILLKNEGHGVSSARNTGIKCAKGEYICFVDSDDWLENNALEKMLAGMKNAQITTGSYRKIGNSMNESLTLKDGIIDKDAFVMSLFHSSEGYQGYCWGKLFRMSIIKEYGIFFDTNLAYNEDRLFVLEYAMHINTAAISASVIYNYRQHSESAMSLSKNLLRSKNISDEIISAHKIKEILNDKYPRVTARLNYNLLAKACIWKCETRNTENIEILVDDLIKELVPNVMLSKNIDIILKIKLIIAFVRRRLGYPNYFGRKC